MGENERRIVKCQPSPPPSATPAGRLDALRRRYALNIAVHRLRPIAQEYCNQWKAAVAREELPPLSQTLRRRIIAAGYRLPTFPAMQHYLLSWCYREETLPDPNWILRTLLPQAARRALIPVSPFKERR